MSLLTLTKPTKGPYLTTKPIINMIPENIHLEFLRLANERSPENLSCDGELSPRQVRQRLKHIDKQWKNLERRMGRNVSEEEVVNQSINNSELRASL